MPKTTVRELTLFDQMMLALLLNMNDAFELCVLASWIYSITGSRIGA